MELRARVRARALRQWFRADDDVEKAMMVQVAKLAVLHEDIMLEIHGALSAADMDTLGHASEAYRRMYFVRRALATAFEMKQAVDVLQRNSAFKRMKKSWAPTSTRTWQKAVRFFSKNHVLISTWRNDVAAKFTEAAVDYALNENKDVVEVEIGFLKPSPEAFLTALDAMALPPSEVVFLDDGAANVDAARRLGLIAHVVRNPVDAECVLRGLAVM
jgi:HAD superfamily hydrolase (TIGR01509 family)